MGVFCIHLDGIDQEDSWPQISNVAAEYACWVQPQLQPKVQAEDLKKSSPVSAEGFQLLSLVQPLSIKDVSAFRL